MSYSLLSLNPLILAFACAFFAMPGAYAIEPPVSSVATDAIDIPFEKFQLDNGLTVIVNEDHSAPIVAVHILYHIGSADEPPGKTGFAHLFEHLMFSGSEHHKGSYFAPFEKVGATGMNASTAFDRTDYYETVPTTALDMALWMESDRMGHLLGAIGQPELDAQRGVVENEKRQTVDSAPYGRSDENILKNVYPANHPYHHPTIGSMADLDAASLEDVKAWFRKNYGAANTILVLAGDITPALARAKVQKYFGDISAGPPVARQQPWVAPLSASTRGIQSDHITQVQIHRTWNVPQSGDPDEPLLELAAAVLGEGATSRLEQRLIYRDKLVDAVRTTAAPLGLGSGFTLVILPKNDVDPAKIDAAVAEEWAKFMQNGPTEDELTRAKTAKLWFFLQNLDSASTRASILAGSQVYAGDPAAYKKKFALYAAATPASVRDAAKRWLTKGSYTLTVVPAKPDSNFAVEDAAVKGLPDAAGKPAPVLPPVRKYATVKSDLDRSQGVPTVSQYPELTFPAVQRARLKNGMTVELVQRDSTPLTRMNMEFNAGAAADQGHKPGTAQFTAEMLDKGTQALDSAEIEKRESRYGAGIGSLLGQDNSNVTLNAMNSNLPAAIALYADVVRHPAFRAADIERERAVTLAGLAQSKNDVYQTAVEALLPQLYGPQHAYGIPRSGAVVEAAVKSLSAADLAAFYRDVYRPDNATLFIVGNTTMEKVLPLLDEAFGDWTAPASPLPKKHLPAVAVQSKPRVFLIDRPDSSQSQILAGVLASPTGASDYFPSQTANGVFGGIFSSRLNMNLREDKHWSYGARSNIYDAVGQRVLQFGAAVQTDKTAESVAEVLKEVRAIGTDKPPTAAEIDKVKQADVRRLPGEFSHSFAMLEALMTNQRYGRPDDYGQKLKSNIDGQTPAQVDAAAKSLFVPEALTWVIVGDLSKIEQPVRALNLGDVKVIDADGKVVR